MHVVDIYEEKKRDSTYERIGRRNEVKVFRIMKDRHYCWFFTTPPFHNWQQKTVRHA